MNANEIKQEELTHPEPTVPDDKRATREATITLMNLITPPVQQFVEHNLTLFKDCKEAGEMTPEREILFKRHHENLINAQDELMEEYVRLMQEQLDAETTKELTWFYGPEGESLRKGIEKALGLSAYVNNIGTLWATRVMERDPDVCSMMMEVVVNYHKRQLPAGVETVTPESASQWKRVEEPTQAEEFVPPSAPEEEAELRAMREGG